MSAEGVTAAELAAALADELEGMDCYCASERVMSGDDEYTCTVCRGFAILDRFHEHGVRPRPPVPLPGVMYGWDGSEPRI